MARKALEVEVKKAGMQGGWVWSLPQSLDVASPPDANEDIEASPSPKMPFESEDAQTKDWAPSGSEGTFEAKFDSGFGEHKESPKVPSCAGEPNDDLSIPKFLRRTANCAG